MMHSQIFQGKLLLAILFIKQPAVVGGKFCLNFSYSFVNFVCGFKKVTFVSALKSRYEVGKEYTVKDICISKYAEGYFQIQCRARRESPSSCSEAG